MDMQELRIRQDLETRLIVKAWENENFKKELLANPKSAIKKELGIDIPDDVNVHIQQEDMKNLYLTLPLNPASVELDDKTLEAVAGGVQAPYHKCC
jgi:hypothetical protein